MIVNDSEEFFEKLDITLNINEDKIKPFLPDIVNAWVEVMGDEYQQQIENNILNANFIFWYDIDCYYRLLQNIQIEFVKNKLINYYSLSNNFKVNLKDIEDFINNNMVFVIHSKHNNNDVLEELLNTKLKDENSKNFFNSLQYEYSSFYSKLKPYFEKLNLYYKEDQELEEQLKSEEIGQLEDSLSLKKKQILIEKSMLKMLNSEFNVYYYDNKKYYKKIIPDKNELTSKVVKLINDCTTSFCYYIKNQDILMNFVVYSPTMSYSYNSFKALIHELGHCTEIITDNTYFFHEVINSWYTSKVYELLKIKNIMPIIEYNNQSGLEHNLESAFSILNILLNDYEEEIKYYKMDNNSNILIDKWGQDNFDKIINLFENIGMKIMNRQTFIIDDYTIELEEILNEINKKKLK